MEKKRVYEVAKEYHLSSEALVSMLRSMDYEVKSHMSVVDERMLEAIERRFEQEKESFRQELRRKARRTEERKQKEAEEKGKEKEKRKRKRRRRRRKTKETDVPAGAVVTMQDTSEEEGKEKEKEKGKGKEKEKGKGKEKEKEKEKGKEKEKEKEKGKGKGKDRGRRRKRQDRGRRRKRQEKEEEVVRVPSQQELEESIRRTFAQMEAGTTRTRRPRSRSQDTEEEVEEEQNVLRVSEFVSVAELAQQMEMKPSEVIAKCLGIGLVVTINQRLDMDTITMVADEFGYEVEPLAEYAQDILEEEAESEDEELETRAPVVTIMGHVDHGKTSLLDHIRESNIIAGEAGGITQHIGAYEVDLGDDDKITFLDTPGHEAFTAMRARGALVTDIVVVIVAANEDVMPQTEEAIDHARAAGVPIIISINKMDLPDADPMKIKRRLTDYGLVVEEWGGNTPAVEVSAKSGQGVKDLLELLILQAQMMELKANAQKRARGVIIESELDKGRGPVATVLVQEGTLRAGDPFVTGLHSGRVRALLDERGHAIQEAGPSVPVQVLGIDGLPQAGDTFFVMASEREAREISQKRQQLQREQDYRRVRRVTLSDIHDRIEEGEAQELRLIVRGDVDGSVQALSDALMQLSNDEVEVAVIHQGVGAVTESDVLLAAASGAIIIGFQVRPSPRARDLAEQEQVDIRPFRVIYEAVDAVKTALSGLLVPEITERAVGLAEVRDTFKIPRVGTVAGCYITSGTIGRGAQVRVLRDNVVVHEGVIESLRRFKEDVSSVNVGFECGIGIEGFGDVHVDDVLEAFEITETERSLE